MTRAAALGHLGNIVGSPLCAAFFGAPVSSWWMAALWPLAGVAAHAFAERHGPLLSRAPGRRP